MAKFGFWNPETRDVDETRDDFTELHTRLEYFEEVGDYYRSQELRSSAGYIHDRTGIVTTDPVAFEAWLATIERN